MPQPKAYSRQWRGVLREYADRLNISDATPIVTLGEGGTPLIPAPALSARTGADGIPRLHLEFIDRQWPLEGIE